MDRARASTLYAGIWLLLLPPSMNTFRPHLSLTHTQLPHSLTRSLNHSLNHSLNRLLAFTRLLAPLRAAEWLLPLLSPLPPVSPAN